MSINKSTKSNLNHNTFDNSKHTLLTSEWLLKDDVFSMLRLYAKFTHHQ